ncbi:MAG: PAS domain S-box protein [Pseudomonadota bacterium]
MTVSTITYVSIHRQSEDFKEDLIQRNQLLADQISFAVKSAFYSLNWIYMEDMLNKTVNSEDILWINILKPDGEVYLSSINKKYEESVILPKHREGKIGKLNMTPGVSKLDDLTLFILKPIEIGKEMWSLCMGVSLHSIEKMKKKIILENVMWGGLILLLGCMISFLLSRKISKPIVQLARATTDISQGKFDHEIPISSSDEIAVLAGSFNQMTSSLNHFRKELMQSEEKFRAISASAQDAIIMLDHEGNISYWNQAAEKIFGYSNQEAMGRKGNPLIMPKRYQKGNKETFEKFRATGQWPLVGKTLELTAVRKNGTEFPIEISVSAINLKGCWNAIWTIRDITERKQAEEEVKKYKENLEHMVEKRTLELRKTQQELVNKAIEAGRAQLSAMVLHNIGNAMTPVRVHVESMKSDELTRIADYLEKSYADLSAHAPDLQRYVNDDPRGKEIFSFMGKLVDSLKSNTDRTKKVMNDIAGVIRYISDILTLQQSYAAKEFETKEQVDLNRLLEDAVKMQKGILEKRDIMVQMDLAPHLPKLMIDKSRLIQVIVNLIKNSYEAFDSLADQSRERRVILKSFHDADGFGFEIIDTGAGISPEALGSVCEFGNSAKGSSGVGLHYCKTFLEKNKGTLTVSSPGKGKGTTVRIAFNLET